MNEYQSIINTIAGFAFTGLGWFARQLWYAVNSLKDDLAKLREELAKEYTTKEDFKEALVEIRGMFEKISDKLSNKADK